MKLLKSIFTIFLVSMMGLYAQAQTLNNPKVPREFAEQFNFNQEREFPNLFLPETYRPQNPESIPADVLQSSRGLLEHAVGSVLNRSVWKITLPGDDKVTSLNLLKYLNSTAKAIDPQAKVYPSGEVLNSTLSYIYKQLYEATANGETDSLKTLKQIISSRNSIPSTQVFGIGERFDVLLDGASPQHEETLKKSLNALINSDFNRTFIEGKLSAEYLDLGRAAFFEGEVHNYSQQMQKNALQGGNTLASLTYDLTTGKFKEPPQDTTCVDQLLRGSVNYTSSSTAPPAARVLRVLSPLLELPFLKIKQTDLLKKEISEVIAVAENNQHLTDQDLAQIGKAANNSLFGGAHNRFWRGSENSLEQSFNLLIRAVTKFNRVSFPIFTDTEKHLKSIDNHEFPKELLMDKDKFFAYHTDQGHLYHGTPRLENIFSILKSGLQVSNALTGNGRSIKGRGAYLSNIKYVAMEYGGPTAPPLEFTVSNSADLRIVEWKAVAGSEYIQNLVKWCQSVDVDLFEYLAQVHHIDIIVYDHILIENSSVLNLTPASKAVAEAFLNSQLKTFIEITEKYHDFDEGYFNILQQTGKMLGAEKELQKAAKHPLRKPVTSTGALRCEAVFGP